MTTVQNITAAPVHPGAFVRAEIIEAHGLTVTEAAKVLGVTRPGLSAFLNEHTHLSADMALRIEKAFGFSLETLMRMQNSYDIAQARKRAAKIKVERFLGFATISKQRAGRGT